MEVPKREFAEAVDRVSTISSEKSRAVEAQPQEGMLTLIRHQPGGRQRQRGAGVKYGGGDLEIGFNSRYLLDIAQQIEGRRRAVRARRCGLADPGARRRRRQPRSMS